MPGQGIIRALPWAAGLLRLPSPLRRLFGWAPAPAPVRGAAPSRAAVMAWIEDVLTTQGGDFDWYLFIATPLDDPFLEAIRAEAANVPLPPDAAGTDRLMQLHRAIAARL